ncbi:MAG: rhodanese-like domain-containing protein [Rivularia sp. (in: Bacteria)]|nr:rhodanese-like domain-containing protein [Rivularia sp. MS3]
MEAELNLSEFLIRKWLIIMKKTKSFCKRFVLLSVLLALCINISACNSSIAGNQQISATKLIEQIQVDKAPVILDVRTREEYSRGHIPGAINIEYGELPSRINEINSLSNQKIVVYCERGVRANIAEETLIKAGFTKVLHLEGDMYGWRERGFKVEK